MNPRFIYSLGSILPAGIASNLEEGENVTIRKGKNDQIYQIFFNTIKYHHNAYCRRMEITYDSGR